MSYLSLIAKNPFRNKIRAALAILGISIGIATIVALGMITDGLTASTQTNLNSGAAEITATATGSNSMVSTGGILNESIAAGIQNINGVNDTAGILRVNTPEQPFLLGLFINGINSSEMNLEGISIVNGSYFSEDSNEIIIGKEAAPWMNKSIGSTINIYGTDFTVVGIYQTGNPVTDGEAFTSLANLQKISNSTGKITFISVKIADNANATEVSQAIENAYPNQLSTTTATQQAKIMGQTLGYVKSASAAISVLAIIIGGIGIINVMIMSVYERTREIGVLKAVGWRSKDILIMILGESIILTLVAAVVGIILGVVSSEALLYTFSPDGTGMKSVFSLSIVIKAFAIALFVGIVGGLYPAYRASRLPPTEALRYE